MFLCASDLRPGVGFDHHRCSHMQPCALTVVKYSDMTMPPVYYFIST